MRAGAGAAGDVGAGHERLQSLRVYGVDDDARTIGLLDQLLQALQDLIGVAVVVASAVDAKPIGEQDRALSSGEGAQAADDEVDCAERAGREAGLAEFVKAIE